MSMELTDRIFWKNYWLAKPQLFNQPIERKSLFKPLFQRVIRENNITNAVEVGGFPGTFSALMKSEFKLPSDLVDYFIDDELLNQFNQTNNIGKDEINAYEIDVFTEFTPPKTYDLVYSIGLIEHFEDSQKIIEGHTKFLNPEKGAVLIIIPNFRGINGWVQQTFDIENYNKHFIQCMDPMYLRKLFPSFKEVESDYFGGFTVWLENYKDQSVLVKGFFKTMWLLGKLAYKVFKFKNRWFSPYIYVVAKR